MKALKDYYYESIINGDKVSLHIKKGLEYKIGDYTDDKYISENIYLYLVGIGVFR